MCLELLWFSLSLSISVLGIHMSKPGNGLCLFKTLFQRGCQSCLPLITSQSSFPCGFFSLKKVETVFLLPLQRSGSSPRVSNSCKTISCPFSHFCSVRTIFHRATQASNKAAESAHLTLQQNLLQWPDDR